MIQNVDNIWSNIGPAGEATCSWGFVLWPKLKILRQSTYASHSFPKVCVVASETWKFQVHSFLLAIFNNLTSTETLYWIILKRQRNFSTEPIELPPRLPKANSEAALLVFVRFLDILYQSCPAVTRQKNCHQINNIWQTLGNPRANFRSPLLLDTTATQFSGLLLATSIVTHGWTKI